MQKENSEIIITHLNEQLKDLSIDKTLEFVRNLFSNERVVFSTSLGWEDQVITHHIFANNFDINIFTLDTGRLFNETYSVFNSTRERYKKNIEVYFPQAEAVQKMLTDKGPLSFFESLENRKEPMTNWSPLVEKYLMSVAIYLLSLTRRIIRP